MQQMIHILNPFAGSNTTVSVAEKVQRKWIAIDNFQDYLEGNMVRFILLNRRKLQVRIHFC